MQTNLDISKIAIKFQKSTVFDIQTSKYLNNFIQ